MEYRWCTRAFLTDGTTVLFPQPEIKAAARLTAQRLLRTGPRFVKTTVVDLYDELPDDRTYWSC